MGKGHGTSQLFLRVLFSLSLHGLTNLEALQTLSSWLFMESLPAGSEVKVSAWNVGDQGSIPGEGNGNPLQYSHPENPMEVGAW